MDIIIMNFILVTAIVTLGYYIVDAIVSLFTFKSSPAERIRRKRIRRSFSLINGTKASRSTEKSFRRAVNS